MDTRSPGRRWVLLGPALVGLGLFLALLVWLGGHPSSILWWVVGPVLLGYVAITTYLKLSKRSDPVDTWLDLHVRYLLLGGSMAIGGGIGALLPDRTPITRLVLLVIALVGIVILVAGLRDFRRWRSASEAPAR